MTTAWGCGVIGGDLEVLVGWERLAERDGVLVARERVIAELLERVAVLEARLGKNSKNSST